VMVLSLNIQAKNACFKMGADYFFDKGRDTSTLIQKLEELNL